MPAQKLESCRVCGNPSHFALQGRVLTHEVSYYDCAQCGYFQTEAPYWLGQAYASAINDVDTGILWRNQLNARRVVMTLAAVGRLSGRVVDHAGGYGILVRLLRDLGVDARWRDKYCQNHVARGFEADAGPCDLITAFEVFEHLEDPLAELRHMLAQAPWVLLSTELVPQAAAPAPDWWYLGPEHGQHIGFFRPATLRYMAKQLACQVATDGRSLHLFSTHPIPRLWHTLQRGSRLAVLICRLMGLKSRTLQDFDLLRRRSS
jgi:hypothetical protein